MTSDLQPQGLMPNTWAVIPELEDLPPLPTMRQAAAAVGISYNTIQRRIADGTLKAYRVGPRLVRVERESLIAMVRSQVMGA